MCVEHIRAYYVDIYVCVLNIARIDIHSVCMCVYVHMHQKNVYNALNAYIHIHIYIQNLS